jgi:spermidine synthase
MSLSESTLPAEPSMARRYLPLMLLLFVGSGCAALIYEIVWFQMLSLSVGSSAISLGVILGVFMGGMCIGSLGLTRVISPKEHPLRVYAKLEAGIGILGLVILVVLPFAGGVYSMIGGPGFVGLLVRGVICAIILLPPTLLMGATLPAIARWVETTPQGMSWLGFFYGGNIVGAVFGCLIAGFYLLRVHDVMTATFAAVVLNAAVSAAGFALSKATPYTPPAEATPAAPKPKLFEIRPGTWPIYLTIGLSGMTALSAEVVWTRLLSLLLGGTVYTFSLILAAILAGLGIGSSVGSMLARSVANPRLALGWCQLLLVGAIAWAALALTQQLPFWPVNPQLATTPNLMFQVDFVRCLWTVLPAAMLWGASFPLALAAVVSRGEDAGRMVGTVYAANTVGGILGAMVTSLLLIGNLGTQRTQQILIVLVGVSALIMLALEIVDGTLRAKRSGPVWAAVTIVLAVVLARSVNKVPDLLVAYGRYMVTWLSNHGDIIYVGEGMNSSMAVSRLGNGVLNYHNAGKIQASSEPQDMRLQRMLGHLTTLVPPTADRVLVIGCGAGVTAGAVSISPRVTNETIAEIEPLVPYVVSKYFSEHNYDVVNNTKKVHILIDDARHYLLTSREKFDAITSDPFDPWVKGAATLYTKEFFEVAKKHLKPGGVVTVFVQLYESSEATVKSEIATFLDVFPNGLVFGNTYNGSGYDVVLLGQVEPVKIDIDAMEQRLASPEYAQVAQSLREIGFNSAVELFSTFAARKPDLQGWLGDAQINRDKNLRLQYLAGMGLNQYAQASIYSNMVQNRKFPEDMFTGSAERIAQLRAAIGGAP